MNQDLLNLVQRRCCPILAALGLSGLYGCQSSHNALLQTIKAAAVPQSAQPFNPVAGIRYLKVEAPGALYYMVLGDIEPGDPHDVEVWYGPGRQVLKLRNGRIFKTAGLPVNWVSSSESPDPSWSEAGSQPVQFVRVRDVIPSYRYSVHETLVLRRTAPPLDEAVRLATPEPESKRWIWFSEETLSSKPLAFGARPSTLPPSLFAVDMQTPKQPVRWSRQCLSPSFCLRMEPLDSSSR